MYKTLKSPLAVQLEITDDCNQVCSHCYRACHSIKKQSTIHLDKEGVVKIINELAHWEVFQVCFTGGEPLMYQDVLMAGVKRASELGIFSYMNTNLQLLNNETISFLKEHKVNVLTSLLSCDEKIHEEIVQSNGSFKRLIENIRRLTDNGIATSVNMVVRQENAHQVYETGRLAFELGVRRFSATKAAPSPGTSYESYRVDSTQLKNSLDDLLRLNFDFGIEVEILESYPLCFFEDVERYARFAKRNCTAGIMNCSISPNGSVRPCSHADMSYGNIFKQSLQDCWIAMHEWRDGSLLYEQCKKCKHLLICTGGCRMDAKLHGGDIKGKDPLMTNPSKVDLPKKTISEIDLPDLMYFYPSAKIRKEEFGGIISLNYEIILLSRSGFDVVEKLYAQKFFAWKEIFVSGLSHVEVKNFFSVLFQKGVVRTI